MQWHHLSNDKCNLAYTYDFALECYAPPAIPAHYTSWVSTLGAPTLLLGLCWLVDKHKVGILVHSIFYSIIFTFLLVLTMNQVRDTAITQFWGTTNIYVPGLQPTIETH